MPTQAIGMRSLAAHLGDQLDMEVITDSSAAIGVCQRRGIGKVKHFDINLLWIQNKIRSGTITLTKVDGKINPRTCLPNMSSSQPLLTCQVESDWSAEVAAQSWLRR